MVIMHGLLYPGPFMFSWLYEYVKPPVRAEVEGLTKHKDLLKTY
jgi:hypothetical protein